MDLLQQLAAVKDFAGLKDYLLDPKTGHIRYEVLPAGRKEDLPALRELLSSPTTAPVGGVAPVTPAPTTQVGPVELLPASMTGGFTLKGFEKQPVLLSVAKGDKYLLKLEPTTQDGGGAHVQFLNPDGSGFGWQKIKKDTRSLTLVAEKTGSFPLSFEANGGTTTFSSASLTKLA
jgi:hypothetical protein